MRALPKLRSDLDVMPSPLADSPGILLRDPFRYTEAAVVIPPPWIPLLQCLDGGHDERDAQAVLTRLQGGRIVPVDEVRSIVDALQKNAFLETEELASRKAERHEAFRRAGVRKPAHAGSAYPESAKEIESSFRARFGSSSNGRPRPLPRAIVAPHVSPEGGFDSYRAAYDVAPEDGEEPTFVILGTSHYGTPERFGVTGKAFETPLGTVPVADDLVDRLVAGAGGAVIEEDYCHAPEHSIELQVVFLQHRLARPFRIVPVLVGPFVDSLSAGRRPEALDENRRFFDALSELAVAEPRLHWVLGVDMSHIGSRYGHGDAVRAGEGLMEAVERADRARLERVSAGDADGFFELVHPGGDGLNWCGYSPLYTFLRAVAPALGVEGKLLNYEQWNIDARSVVTFAAMHFDAAGR